MRFQDEPAPAARACKACGQALRPEESFCPFCPGEKAAARIREPEAVLGVEEVEARRDGDVFHGSLVIARDGFFLFVESFEAAPKVHKSLALGVMESAAGVWGGLAKKAAERFSNEKASLPAGLEPREEFSYLYDGLLAKIGRLVRCPWCLPLRRESLRSASLYGEHLLVLQGSGKPVEISASFGADALAFMKSRGLPVRRAGSGLLRRVRWRVTGALVLLMGAFAAFNDIDDLKAAGDWLFPRAMKVYNEYSLNKPDPVRRILQRDGRRYFLMRDGREIPESELPADVQAVRRWRGFAEYGAFFIMIVVLGGGGVWLLLKFLV